MSSSSSENLYGNNARETLTLALKRSRSRRYRLSILAAAAGAVSIHIPAAHATTDQWKNIVVGDWGTPGSWVAGLVPANGDSVNLVLQNAATFSVDYNYTLGGVTLNTVQVDDAGGSNTAILNFVSTLTPILTTTNENIGVDGHGEVIQSTGTNTIDGTNYGTNGIFALAYDPNGTTSTTSSGIYILTGNGTLSLTGAPEGEYLGVNAGSFADFVQAGGSNTINQSGTPGGSANLYVGWQGNFASYTLGGGSLTMNGGAGEFIGGGAGTSVFNQTAGFNNINSGGTLAVGFNAATSSYTLSGGTLTVSGSSSEIIGNGLGSATFNQTGGTNFLNFDSNLYVANVPGEAASYLLQNGSLTNSLGSDYVGNYGTGVFVQSGGNNAVSNQFAGLYVGYNPGSTGSYSLQAGTLTVGGFENIGDSGGNGTFNQSGGSHTVTGTMFLGGVAAGSYYLSAGTLTVTGGEGIGPAEGLGGVGSFVQTGGVNNVSGNVESTGCALEIGELMSDDSVGFYTLQGGTLNVTGVEDVGDDGQATFQQNGGVNNVTGFFYLGSALQDAPDNIDYYTMTAGTLAVSGEELVGTGTYARFSQNGGFNNITSASGLLIGGTQNLTSYYSLGAGVLAPTNITVSYSGALDVGGGMVNMPSGTLTTVVENGAYNNPAVNFAGGSIILAALNFNGSPSVVNWSGGTLQLTQGLTFDSGSANTTSQAFGNSLSLQSGMALMVTGNETIGGSNAFTLTINPGSTDVATGQLMVAPLGTLIQDGPIVQSLTNLGTYVYDGGAFSGVLNNVGQTSLGASFSPTSITNTGTILEFAFGSSITLTGGGLFNGGNFSLDDTIINAGANTVSNSGLLSGFGSITAASISNAGTINLSAGLTLQLNAASVTNDGTIDLDNGFLSGAATLTNNADGVISGPGFLSLTTFLNNGTVYLPAGTLKVGSFTNNGIVDLQSAAASISAGGTMINNGLVEGFGKVGQNITNNSEIQPLGGQLVLSGTVTNPSSGQIAIADGDNLLVSSGLATNAGLISLTGGVFDNGNQVLNNTGQISGYGTIRTGGLTNNGTMVLTGGSSTVNGPLTNNTLLALDYQPATFTGSVFNYGTIKTTGMTATFVGSFTNEAGSHYISDPSTNVYSSGVTNAGAMTGGSGDQYLLFNGTFNNQGNFTNLGLLSSSDSINNSGTFAQTGSLTQSANMTNSGSATIGGIQNWGVGTTFTNTAGNASFLTDAGSAAASTLSVNVTGGTVAFNHSQHLAGLSVSGLGVADLVNNTIYLNFGSPGNDPVTAIVAALTSGYHGGSWTGPGIVSSTAAAGIAASSTPILSVGYADGNIDNGSGNSTQTSAIANQVLIKMTLAGDANLDGVVDFNDLFAVGKHLNTTGNDWAQGNFDYAANGGVDFNDLFIIGQNLNKTLGNLGNSSVSDGGGTTSIGDSIPAGLSVQIQTPVQFQLQTAIVSLPEPTAVCLLAAGAGGLLARRRRNKRA